MPSDWSFVSLDIELTNQCSSECLMSQREGITRPKGVMSRKSFEDSGMNVVSVQTCLHVTDVVEA